MRIKLLLLCLVVMECTAQENSIRRIITLGTLDNKNQECYVCFDYKYQKLEAIRIYLPLRDKNVTTAYVEFTRNTMSYKEQFVNTLKGVKRRYEKWAKLAAENNVTNYNKSMHDKFMRIFNAGMFINFKKGSSWYSSPNSSPTSKDRHPDVYLKPSFNVDEKGNATACLLTTGITGYYWAYDTSRSLDHPIWTALDRNSAYNSHKETLEGAYGFVFRSAKQIQDLIDMLSNTSYEYQNTHVREKTKEIDKIFK